jgi:hypothetical protein
MRAPRVPASHGRDTLSSRDRFGQQSSRLPTGVAVLALDDQERGARLLPLGKEQSWRTAWRPGSLPSWTTGGTGYLAATAGAPDQPGTRWGDGMPQSTKHVGERELASNAGENPCYDPSSEGLRSRWLSLAGCSTSAS